jgi:hypothetical protein
VGAGCFDRQHLSRVVQLCRQAIAQWGAPEAVVSDHAGVFLALNPYRQQLGIRWSRMAWGHPWQHLAEGGFSIQRRMLDDYGTGCTDRAMAYQPQAPFVQDDPSWRHGAHTRSDAQGRISYLSPEIILGNARGHTVEPVRLRWVFRQGLWGQTVDVLLYDEAVRVSRTSTCWCPIPVSMIPGNVDSPPWMRPAASNTTAFRWSN